MADMGFFQFRSDVVGMRRYSVSLPPRQHHSSGPPVAISEKKATGGPPLARRRQLEGEICHSWTTGASPPVNNVASGLPTISWTSVRCATTGNRWHSKSLRCCLGIECLFVHGLIKYNW